jgi:transposase
MYAKLGRPSIPPEHLLKGCLLMALYSIRSERQFCERLQYDLLFKWFLDLNVEDPAFDHSSFAKNRDRLLQHEVARRFFEAVLEQARRRHLLSSDHFTVDGTLLEAWASLKSLRPRDEDDGEPGAGAGGGRNPEVNWHGRPRSNATHISKTDPEARLARKGNNQPAKLYFSGHLLMENRNGLAVDVLVTEATGYAEREAALEMLGRYRPRTGDDRWTVGADKGYDIAGFVDGCRELGVTPHVAQNTSNRRSAIDGGTADSPGYQVSQRVRKRIEEIMGWVKVVGGGRKLRYIGVEANQLWAEMTTTAYNLIRISNLVAEGA